MTRESEFREQLREWAARPPQRPAHEVARRARATRAVPWRAVSSPFVWAAAALAVAFASWAFSRAAERGHVAPAARVRATPAAAAPAPSRFVVLELRSGSRLYVDLATMRRTS